MFGRQCVETIQEEPKLEYYQIGGAETTLIHSFRGDNYLQDSNMVKIESRLQQTLPQDKILNDSQYYILLLALEFNSPHLFGYGNIE